jgi:hypothetical protein
MGFVKSCLILDTNQTDLGKQFCHSWSFTAMHGVLRCCSHPRQTRAWFLTVHFLNKEKFHVHVVLCFEDKRLSWGKQRQTHRHGVRPLLMAV